MTDPDPDLSRDRTPSRIPAGRRPPPHRRLPSRFPLILPDPGGSADARRIRALGGRWRGRTVSLVLVVLVAVFLGVALVRNWQAVRSDLQALSWVDLLASGIAGALAVTCSGMGWRVVLRAGRARARAPGAHDLLRRPAGQVRPRLGVDRGDPGRPRPAPRHRALDHARQLRGRADDRGGHGRPGRAAGPLRGRGPARHGAVDAAAGRLVGRGAPAARLDEPGPGVGLRPCRAGPRPRSSCPVAPWVRRWPG